MSNEDLRETLEAIEKIGRELESSPEKALAFLVRAGIAMPSGELTEPYRPRA